MSEKSLILLDSLDQPNNRKQDRQTNNGYQPTQSTLTTPPSKGSNVHPAKKD